MGGCHQFVAKMWRHCWISPKDVGFKHQNWGFFVLKLRQKRDTLRKTSRIFGQTNPWDPQHMAPGNLTPAALRLGENTVTHGKRAIDE